MMGTISNKLTYLKDTKEAVRNAIEAKGVTVSSSDSFRSYADKIANIEQSVGGSTDIEDSIVTRTLTSYVNNRVTSIGNHVFMNSGSLKSVSFSKVKSCGLSSFNGCTALIDVDLPMLESLSTQTFYGCSALVRLSLPKLKTVAVQSIRNCKKLAIVDLASCTSVSALSFDSDESLKCLIIRTSTRCNLAATSAFGGTPIANGTGYIYVPRALVETYKSASYWSTYAAQFRALEDYTVDGTTVGDIDESKI